MFKDKVAVITGGALGIGRCLTREFAKVGCKVAFIDINKKEGEKNLNYLLENDCDALFYNEDLAKEESLNEFASLVIEKFEKVDFLINNGSINLGGLKSKCSYADFNQVLKVGVTAPYFLTSLFLPYFSKNSSIINIISTRAFMSQSDTESYSATKGALFSLTHALAITLEGQIRVNSIAPGWIDTGKYYDDSYIPKHPLNDQHQHPSKRIGIAEDIAQVALFLCDEKNSFINGENITVDGGMSKLMIYSGDYGWSYKE